MKQWHFFDKVYRVWVVLAIGDYGDFKQFLKDCTYTEDYEDGNAGACIYLNKENTTNGNRAFIVYLSKFETACLVHELTHLAMMVFVDKGVFIGNENTEAYAYYVEFWFNEMTRVRRKLPNGRAASAARPK